MAGSSRRSLSLHAESSPARVFCKFCQLECTKLVSQSSANPGRQYFSCPVSFEQGGHGFMHWVDCGASPNRRFYSPQTTDQVREQLALCEATLRLVEGKKNKYCENVALLKEELAVEKEKARWLFKCLKGVLCLFVVVLLFLLF